MAWVFDAANTGATSTTSPASFSWTVGDLTDGLAIVWVAWVTLSTSVSSVDFAGTAMVQAVHNVAANRGVAIYYLYNPPESASRTVTITFSASPSRWVAGGHTWSGANSTQTPQTITGNGTSANPSITCLTGATELIVDCLAVGFTAGETLVPDANQTERGNLNGGATRGASSSQLGSDGGVMSWTDSASRAYNYCAASFDAAVAGGVPHEIMGDNEIHDVLFGGQVVH